MEQYPGSDILGLTTQFADPDQEDAETETELETAAIATQTDPEHFNLLVEHSSSSNANANVNVNPNVKSELPDVTVDVNVNAVDEIVKLNYYLQEPEPELDQNDEGDADPGGEIPINVEQGPQPKRCIICFYAVEDSENANAKVDGEGTSSSSMPPAPQFDKKLEYIYKMFNIKTKTVGVDFLEILDPPFCPMCTDSMLEAKRLIDQLEEIQQSLSLLREQMKGKLMESFEMANLNLHESAQTQAQADSEVDPMNAVIHVRKDIMNLISSSKKRKVGRPKGTKRPKISISSPVKIEKQEQEQDTQLENEINPYVALETLSDFDLESPPKSKSNLKPQTHPQSQSPPKFVTSRGRVVKKPKRIYGVFDEDDESKPRSSTSASTSKRDTPSSSPTKSKTEANNDNNDILPEPEIEEIEIPDSEWSPGHTSAEEEESESDDGSTSSSSDEDEEDLSMELKLLEDHDDEDHETDAISAPVKTKTLKRKLSTSTTPKSRFLKPKRRKKTTREKPKSQPVSTSTSKLVSLSLSSSRRKKTRIPIKIRGTNGEEYDGVYIKPEGKDKENDVLEQQQQEFQEQADGDEEGNLPQLSLVKILKMEPEPGAVVSILDLDDIPGVRIICSDETCLKTFSTVDLMLLHVKRIHEGMDPFDCVVCGKSFASVRLLKLHLKDHGVKYYPPEWMMKGKRKYNCEFQECEMAEFRNLGDLQIHIRSIHTHEKPFKCVSCEEAFVSVLKREYHIEQHHYDIPPLKCEHCPRAYFRQHRLRDHIKSHTGEKSYLCEICSKSFSQPAYLRYHQTQHAELALEPYKCDNCDKTFATPVNLRIHQKTQHLKDYRYHCEICNHGATHRSHLKLHMRTHSGERPHICDYCNKSFTRASQLKIHVRGHTGERPYVCKQCPKTFTNSSKLRRHELIHAQSRPYKCEICERGFSQLSNLQSHIRATHTKKKSSSSSMSVTMSPSKKQQQQLQHLVQHQQENDELQETVECVSVFQPIQHHQIFTQSLADVPFIQMVNTGELDSGEPTYQEFILIPSLEANFTTK